MPRMTQFTNGKTVLVEKILNGCITLEFYDIEKGDSGVYTMTSEEQKELQQALELLEDGVGKVREFLNRHIKANKR